MRAAFWAAFWFVALFLPADLAQAQTAAPDTFRIGPTTAVVYIVDMTPPAVYERWYHQAERCISAIAPRSALQGEARELRGRYRKVRWFVTARPWTSNAARGQTLAAWQPGHRITVSMPYAADSAIIVHESIHDILAWNHLNDPNDPHQLPYFDGRCARAAYANYP